MEILYVFIELAMRPTIQSYELNKKSNSLRVARSESYVAQQRKSSGRNDSDLKMSGSLSVSRLLVCMRGEYPRKTPISNTNPSHPYLAGTYLRPIAYANHLRLVEERPVQVGGPTEHPWRQG